MYMEMMKQFQDQAQRFSAPWVEMNQLLADHYQQLTRLQQEAGKHYTDLSIDQIQACADVKDLQTLTALAGKQMQLMGEISGRMMQDMQTLNEMGQAFRASMDKLTRPQS
ncbi:phasin family protein [Ferrimonas sediminicola]|uniref:Phasin family protein n=1 Tax=Ferrimonas sediminicola TaxID=2569538 RepID=A0A4U1BIM3_9GAMM|nr:phasin family protein [Ferrimonas sediminicola]TKB51310.1 phasin family protein [Ferrimonas sediminicola]